MEPQQFRQEQEILKREMPIWANDIFARFIQKINLQLGIGITYDKIFNFVFESLNLLIPYDHIGIALSENNNSLVRVRWAQGTPAVESLRKNFTVPFEKTALREIFDSPDSWIVNDLKKYLDAHPDAPLVKLHVKNNMRSSLICPLRVDGLPIGVVAFSSVQTNAYSQKHLASCISVADELAVILEQARLKHYFEQNESKTKSLSSILHDLQSPLSVIHLHLNSGMQQKWYKNLSDDIRKVWSTLDRNTKYMIAMMEHFTSVVANQNFSDEMHFKKVNLQDFISEEMDAAQMLANNKEIRLKVSISPDLPETAQFDREKIKRVLDNLLSNAIKFSQRHTCIHVSVNSDGGRLIFNIADQGQGIDSEDIPNLFAEYGKTKTNPTEGESSTGLGLHIAKHIIEKHGGEISVSSQLEVGSIFTFWIPLSKGMGRPN